MRRPVVFGMVFGLALCGSFRVGAQIAPYDEQSLDIIIDRLAADLFAVAELENQHDAGNPEIGGKWDDLGEEQKQPFRARAARTLLGVTRGTSI